MLFNFLKMEVFLNYILQKHNVPKNHKHYANNDIMIKWRQLG